MGTIPRKQVTFVKHFIERSLMNFIRLRFVGRFLRPLETLFDGKTIWQDKVSNLNLG